MFIYLFIFMYFVGLITFCLVSKHFLMMLLSLEFVMMSLLLGLFLMLLSFNYEIYFIMIFMIMVVSEGVLGLSILVSIIRVYGNDYFQSFNMLW
uniref:NADH dehydrogenase subunit 4L n=1 Tax=Platystethus arenarius TaxID=347436 RepID=UPI002A82C520|nr:NADH dehydrogenase subunit 4L [Platystethus arenarius]WON66117.1 NADH dehydrogenase subunit 4L [Platystethus arenarius]